MAEIIITKDELNDPAIDDVINLQKSLQSHSGERIEDIKVPLFYNPIFYYGLAAALGTLTAWAIAEPFIQEGGPHERTMIPFIGDYIVFGPVAGMLGLAIGCVYGLVNRNVKQMLYCGVVGIGVGMGATIISTFIADILFMITTGIAASITGPHEPVPGEFPVKGVAFFIFMCGRGIAWSIISIGAGLGLGVALKSKKLVLNGIVGGMIGGLLGGLFFDPIHRFILHAAPHAGLSRFVGFLAVGSFVGMFTGLFENLSKEAWFQMLRGPLTGKQFIVFKSPMLVGSSPKCDIYLFKDPDIAPKHATVTKSGSRYLLADEGSDKGTFVNGRKVDKYVLQHGDTITIGETVLRYSEKAK